MGERFEHGDMLSTGILALSYDRPGDGGVVRLDGADADRALRDELYQRIGAGERVELLMQAQTYAQGPGVLMRKPLEFAEEGLASFARTAPTTPFQFNHSLLDQDCGGHCVESQVAQVKNTACLHEKVVLNTPRGMLSALRGNMLRFSIQWEWARPDSVLCSICLRPIRRCDHWPGNTVKVDGKKQIVRLRFTAVRSIERSHVMFPACEATGPLSWEALSAGRTSTHYLTAKDEIMDPKELAKLLGLAEGAGEAAIKLEVQRIRGELEELGSALDSLKDELDKERQRATRAEAERDEARATLEDQSKAQRAAKLEATIGELRREGRITDGGGREKLLREVYAEGTQAWADELVRMWRAEPPLVPVAASAPKQANDVTTISPISPPVGGACGATGTDDATGGGVIDYRAAFDALPEHLRMAADDVDPEGYLRANADLCRTYGLPVLPPPARPRSGGEEG